MTAPVRRDSVPAVAGAASRSRPRIVHNPSAARLMGAKSTPKRPLQRPLDGCPCRIADREPADPALADAGQDTGRTRTTRVRPRGQSGGRAAVRAHRRGRVPARTERLVVSTRTVRAAGSLPSVAAAVARAGRTSSSPPPRRTSAGSRGAPAGVAELGAERRLALAQRDRPERGARAAAPGARRTRAGPPPRPAAPARSA